MFELISPKLGHDMYLGLQLTDYIKRSKVTVTAFRQGHVSPINEGHFTQFRLQVYLHS